MKSISDCYLDGVTADFMQTGVKDLLARWNDHQAWFDGRLEHGIDSYSKSTRGRISTVCDAAARPGGACFSGVNFASQEYLSLSSHPRIQNAAKAAIDECGVHSAGSAALMGNTALSVALEAKLAAFLGYADCTVFPTGWGAGYGLIKTLVQPGDHVVIDVLAHACLQEGARNATRNVHTFSHLSNGGVRRRLERIQREAPGAGVLVVTESVFSMDSDVPDLAGLHAICREFHANLLVDVAHDLGAIGPTGGGHLELQGMTGVPDIVMGSFSKTFASNGGFLASNAPGLKLALRYGAGPLTFTNALSPVQAAIVSEALDVIGSDDGAARRQRLLANANRMREALTSADFQVLGQPSAIVPVILGDNAPSRLMTRYALEGGGIVNLVEYPAVSRNTCRWRIQIMADHTDDQIDQFVRVAVRSREQANDHVKALGRMGSTLLSDAIT